MEDGHVFSRDTKQQQVSHDLSGNGEHFNLAQMCPNEMSLGASADGDKGGTKGGRGEEEQKGKAPGLEHSGALAGREQMSREAPKCRVKGNSPASAHLPPVTWNFSTRYARCTKPTWFMHSILISKQPNGKIPLILNTHKMPDFSFCFAKTSRSDTLLI